MKQILLLVFSSFAITCSMQCPAWKCQNDISSQQNKGDKEHCVEFKNGNEVYLYNQKDACSSKDTNCFIEETVRQINNNDQVALSGSSSFCWSDLKEYDDYYQILNDYVYIQFYKKECQSYIETKAKCKPFDTEEWEELYDSEEYNYYEDEDKKFGWDKCTTKKDCLGRAECTCVPNDGTFGRCDYSWLDNELIDAALAFSACEYEDQEVFCSLFSLSPLTVSLMEGDLECLSYQTWDLQLYSEIDFKRVMSAYNHNYKKDVSFSWFKDILSRFF